MRFTPLLGLGAFGAAAYGAYRYFTKQQGAKPVPQHAAFADDEAGRNTPNAVRDAGPAAMRSDPSEWDDVDQASDESFPSSDPPGRY